MPNITLPELPPLIINGSAKNRDAMTYKNTWVPVKKRPARSKGNSRSVGKCLPVNGKKDCWEIVFKEDFKKEHPGLEKFRVYRYRGGRLEFKPIDPEDSIRRTKEIVRLHGGATWALNQLVGATPLAQALQATFPERHLGICRRTLMTEPGYAKGRRNGGLLRACASYRENAQFWEKRVRQAQMKRS